MISSVLALLVAVVTPVPAFPGAEGFGATSRGGTGGRVLRVKSLDDDKKHPAEGTLRWAVEQPGPRIVHFDVAGTIQLKDTLIIREPFITIDGSDAPGDGVCLRDHSLNVKDSHDVIVRYIRIRRGDVETLKDVKAKGLARPKGSFGLDCVSLDDSSNILFDHVSLSWCCDEVFGIVRCKNVTVQWCLLAEPLSNPMIHPYGDNHAYCPNCSASTLSIHHCLMAHYVMRGPQFECNDVRRGMGYDVKMEAINNVLFDYQQSGSRYTAGIEDHPEEAAGTTFQFQFINNRYLGGNHKPEVACTLKHGVVDALKVHVAGNIGPNRLSDHLDQWAVLFAEKTPMRDAEANVRAQVSDKPLFAAPVPVTTQSALAAAKLVLEQAGCSNRRGPVDLRILDDVRQNRTGKIVHSQDDVGGWPELK